jgi:diguanylate cyclase (GGDEF)-like protein
MTATRLIEQSEGIKVNKEAYLRDMKARFRLTRRETDTLRILLEGLKNAAIAEKLMISEQTVKDHLSRIYKKIGVKNRFELMHSLVKLAGRKAKANISASAHAEKTSAETSLTDELTGTYNRKGLLALADHQIKLARRQKENLCMFHAEVERTGTIADSTAPGGTDVILKDAANILKKTFRESDVIARVGGDEFLVIPLGVTEAEADQVAARLKKNLELFNSKRNGEPELSINYTTSHCDPAAPCSLDRLLFQTEEDKKKE